MFAETLDNFQLSKLLIPESRSCTLNSSRERTTYYIKFGKLVRKVFIYNGHTQCVSLHWRPTANSLRDKEQRMCGENPDVYV
jgi:hypothetical protein